MRIAFDFLFFLYEIPVAISYIPVVLVLTVVPMVTGTAIGGLLAFSRIYHLRGLELFARVYVVICRSIPLLLQMFLAYYFTKGIYAVFDLDVSKLNKFIVVLVTLSLNATGALSEGIRSGLLSVEQGQFEAAYSVGMTRTQTALFVVLPQHLPVAIPSFGSAFIAIMKGSTAAYLLGIVEMIQGTSMKTAGNYKYLEAYCATALVYWCMTMLIERLTFFMEKKIRRHIKGGVR
jgi:His/Glu/Gln/Arg/opine family amino acid ABC transporter permease subunit